MTRKQRTIHEYCSANPAPTRHRKAGEKTAVRRNPLSGGWAWKPDENTAKALKRGTRKIRKAKEAEHQRIMEKAKMATTSKRKSSKKVSKKTTAKKVATKSANGLIPLKKICQQLKLDPKMARRKLRDEGVKGHDAKSRWQFTAAQAKRVKAVLQA
jgi:hypothetical protein